MAECCDSSCRKPAVVAITWSACSNRLCERPDGEERFYCKVHDDAKTIGENWVCRLCGTGHASPRRRRTPYEALRETYLDTFLIADKEAMLAAVTLDQPVNSWNIWENILAESQPEPPKPALRKIGDLRLSDKIGKVPVWLLGLWAVMMVILVTLAAT